MVSPRKLANTILVASHVPRYRIRQRVLVTFAGKVLKKLRYSDQYLSIVFVSDRRIRKLNQRFLGHGWATDVLAFGLDDPRFLGEVVISPDRARVQAKHLGVSMNEELLRYVCHGILHLSGYRDKSRPARDRMRRAEDRLLRLVPARTRRVI